MPQIRVKNGKQRGKILLVRGDRISIGRDPGCGLQIIDTGVSREHAEVYRVGEMVFIRDMSSRNHTFVNEEKVQEELLREGDVIRVGTTQLVFESTQAAKAQGQDLQFEEGQPYRTSLELKLDDLYAADMPPGRESELFKAVCLSTQIVQGEREEKKLFERLLDLIQEYIPADHLYLFLHDEGSGSITPRAMRGKSDGKSVPISRGILRRVIQECRAVLTADAMQDARFKADDSIVMHQIRSVLCVPIQAAGTAQGAAQPGQAMGAIYAVNMSLTETFEQSDLQLITAMGTQLAIALDNLYLIRSRRRMFLRTIGRLVSLLEGVAPGKKGHAERVSGFAAAIAAEMRLTDRDALAVTLAAMLHDIGKVPAVSGLSAADTERSSGAAHILAGIAFVRDLPGLGEILPLISAHHERYDGSGVPQQLKGAAIPLGARIVAVASDFEKMVFPEPLAAETEADPAEVRKAFAHFEAQSGKLYDPEVVRALIVGYRHGKVKAGSLEDSSSRNPLPPLGPDEKPGLASQPRIETPTGPAMQAVASRPTSARGSTRGPRPDGESRK